MWSKLHILFLGEPTSANTMSWIKGMEDAGCKVSIASARSDGKGGVYPLGKVGLPAKVRILTGLNDLNNLIADLKPDLLIAYRITSYGYLASKTNFYPLVLAAQNEQITWMPGSSFWRLQMLKSFAKRAVRRADLIHAWGDNIRHGLLRFGADDSKIMVLHRGIDLTLFSTGETFNPVPTDTPVFISTRSLEPEYLLDQLVKGFSILHKDIPNAKLIIIGDGSEKTKLDNLITELKLQDNVIMRGKLTSKDVAREIKNAHIYISLIQTEGISSSLIEVCASGLLPVVGDMPASKEVIGNDQAGIFIGDTTPENVATLMKQAVSDREKQQAAYNNASSIRKRYERKTNIGRFLDEYRKRFNIEVKKKLHICHITTSHKPSDIRIFRRECLGSIQKGYKVTIVTRGREMETIDGVDIIPVRYILGKLGRKFILPKIAVTKARKLNADIYHFHDPELLPWMCLLAKHYGARVVWDVHELYPTTIKEFYVRHCPPLAFLLGKWFTTLEKSWCQPFSGVVAVTDPITERYEKMGFNSITVRNVIDLKQMPEIKQIEKEHDFTIIASGTTNHSRCINQLIDAFAIVSKKHPDTSLRLLALFDSWREEQRIRSYIEEKNLACKTNISLLIPWKQLVSEEIPKAHLGVVLYQKSENNLVGLPNRLFEYWACKLPVVATDTPLLTKIVSGNKAGLVIDSQSPENIANAINYYIENPKAASEAGENGYQAVLETYNWEHEMNKLNDFYEKILSDISTETALSESENKSH